MVMKWVLVIAVLGIAVFLVSCATGVQTDRPYQEIGRAKHFQLEADGLIIGFEKRNIRGESSGILGRYEGQPLYSNLVEHLADEAGIRKKRNKLFRRYAYFNSKIMMPTQIVSSASGTLNYRYNAYADSLDGVYDYDRSFDELTATFQSLRENEFRHNGYTHIIVMNMGWNNDQAESLWRYNKIISNLKHHVNDDSVFKPFVIAITWPSVWRSINDFEFSKKLFHMISYPNKTLDADELGVSWINWIINDQLPALVDKTDDNTNEKSPKIVLIGHSLGARILSRAVFSSEHLLDSNGTDKVDLLIGLQPAFSALRFVEDHGLEGYPYAGFAKKKTRLVFTTSVKDRANPMANYITRAKHLGGKHGLDFAMNHAGENDVFDIHTWSDASLSTPPDYDGRVVLIDASSIVVGTEEPKLSAHNDILDIDMAKLIWHHINAL